MFESMPCIVELFGHQRIAGKVTQEQMGGSALIRVDVPTVENQLAFTKFYGIGAIYAITPVDEPTMLQAIKSFRSTPIDRSSLQIPEKVTSQDGYDEDDDLGSLESVEL